MAEKEKKISADKPARQKKASGPVEHKVSPRKKVMRTSPPEDEEISSDAVSRMVSETAYFIACDRGFSGGSPEEDWIEAERRVSRMLQES